MNRHESKLMFSLASAIRDFSYFRDELIQVRDKFAHVIGLESRLNGLIDELEGSITLFKQPLN